MVELDVSAIRELNKDELDQLNDLISESFGYEGQHKFFDDFPIWKSNEVKRYGIFSTTANGAQKLISHVGIRFFEMLTSTEMPVSMAMVGAVATDEDFRGHGLSTKLLKHVITLSEEQNCDWTILWGSEHDFYRKLEFELAGEQFQAALSILDDLPENKIPHVKKGWHEKIFDYLLQTNVGVKISEKDRTWISGHSTVNWFYHEEPFAFVGFERGIDLPNIVHEMGGDPRALKEVLGYVLSLDLSAQVLGTEKILLSLGFKDADLIEEYLCLARPHSQKKNLVWKKEYWVSGLSAC